MKQDFPRKHGSTHRADRGSAQDWSYREPKEAPYHFVPVEPELSIVDRPVFHDGANAEQENLLSGELCCSLQTLTPLLCGNRQRDLSGPALGAFRRHFSIETVDPKKSLIEPLYLRALDDGTPELVLIAGTALKGPLRSSLQSLLAAPMERVAERSFSYRPLSQLRNEAVGVVVQDVGPDEADKRIEVRPILFSELVWVEDRGREENVRKAMDGGGKELTGYKIQRKGNAKFLVRDDRGSADLRKYMIAPCLQGLDGHATLGTPTEEELAEVKSDKRRKSSLPKPGRSFVLVPKADLRCKKLIIPLELYRQYLATLDHLMDVHGGHLSNHPRVDEEHQKKRILQNLQEIRKRGLKRNDLIFLEMVEDRILSFGRFFRYRWTYRDSVRWRSWARCTDRQERAILRPDARELENPQGEPYLGAPQLLTGARLLFGYVGPRKGSAAFSDPATGGIGRGDFQQLAGRVAVNFAVEVRDAERRSRFLNEGKDYLVALRPLSSPKPSAYEFYLEQDPEKLKERRDGGLLSTYGDDLDDDSAGELRGRKLYLHQPDAACDSRCYELNPSRPGDRELYGSQQCAVARFVSASGSCFRFRIRFRDLRPWELGALLFVMEMNLDEIRRLIGSLPGHPGGPFTAWLGRTEKLKDPIFALKLGHGRPLGLGSARLTIERAALLRRSAVLPRLEDPALKSDLAAWRRPYLDAFYARLAAELGNRAGAWVERIFLPWLELHRFTGRRRYDYPVLGSTIYDYHTQVHQEHLRGRKKSSPDEELLGKMGIMSLSDYDTSK